MLGQLHIGTGVVISALGYVYAFCEYVGQLWLTFLSHFSS